MAIILHITAAGAWQAALAAGAYAPPSLAAEGFVHGSTYAQVAATANRYFAGRTDLVLLCIDERRVDAPIRYEPPVTRGAPGDARADERFPHIYGPIALDAVVRVVAFRPAEDGTFAPPADLP